MATTQAESNTSVSWIEHQMLEHVKGALRVTLDWDAPTVSLARKKSSLRFSLQSFCRHLERLMRIEERDNYFVAIADSKPYLQPQIHRLQLDHERFRERIHELTPRMDSLLDWQDDEFRECCDEIRELLKEVDQHDHAEVRLLQDMLSYDEGGEG
jgi:hypothetical protein